MARFEVREVFRLPSRGEFVLAGRIAEGEIKAGMSALVCLDGKLFWELPVKSIEYIDRVSVGESLIGLVCTEQDAREADTCSDLCPPGTIIEVKATEHAA